MSVAVTVFVAVYVSKAEFDHVSDSACFCCVRLSEIVSVSVSVFLLKSVAVSINVCALGHVSDRVHVRG